MTPKDQVPTTPETNRKDNRTVIMEALERSLTAEATVYNCQRRIIELEIRLDDLSRALKEHTRIPLPSNSCKDAGDQIAANAEAIHSVKVSVMNAFQDIIRIEEALRKNDASLHPH